MNSCSQALANNLFQKHDSPGLAPTVCCKVREVTGTKPRSHLRMGRTDRLKPHDCRLTHILHSLVISLFFPHSSIQLQTQIKKQSLPADTCPTWQTQFLSFFPPLFLQPIVRSSCSSILCSIFARLHLFRIQKVCWKRGCLCCRVSQSSHESFVKTQGFFLFLDIVISFVPVASDFLITRWTAGSECQHLVQTRFTPNTAGKSTLTERIAMLLLLSCYR